MNNQDINAQTIDRWIDEGWEWGRPISHEVFVNAINGEWDVCTNWAFPLFWL